MQSCEDCYFYVDMAPHPEGFCMLLKKARKPQEISEGCEKWQSRD
ncbi:MAG: hypothetical protein ACXQTP_03095 [Candidatus Methanofastidiosia archaeon]